MSQGNMITKKLMSLCAVLSLSAITGSMFAMERPEGFSKKFTPKVITADIAQQKDKREKAQIKKQNKEDQVLAKRAQEIAQADKTFLTVEKVSNKKAFYPDKDSQDINFEAVIPTKKNVKSSTSYVGTPMPTKKSVVHTNPMRLGVGLNYYIATKDTKSLKKILNDDIYKQQIMAFKPYHAIENAENIENFNRNMLGAQQWIVKNEQAKKSQKTKNNNNNNS
jgi:hypothetical protein